MRIARSALHALGELIWPRDCLLCDAPMPPEPSPVCLCPKCQSELATDPFATCARCASSIGPHVPLAKDCPRCRSEVYHFKSAQRLGVYDGRLREAVLKIKNPRRESLAESLGLMWGEHARSRLLQSNPQVIVPVPLHWRRRWERGSNQCESLARGLGLALKLPVNSWAVQRIRATPVQTTQTPAERRRNVIGAFRGGRLATVKDLRVLLVDDVLTTGATCEAVTLALLTAGAAQVDVAVLAHR
jgi:ComF family protein